MARGFTPGNLRVYVCSHVFAQTRPILLVAREGADWMFLCGEADHDASDCNVVGVAHLTDRDPSLQALSDLPDGFEAERVAVGSPWIRGHVGTPG